MRAFIIKANKNGKGGVQAAIDIKAVGVWAGCGREVTDEEKQQDGALLAVANEFRALTKAYPDKPKPMFISWKPTGKEKMLFNTKLRGGTLHMRVLILRNTEVPYSGEVTMRFDGVKISRVVHSHKLEEIQASFKEFFVDESYTRPENELFPDRN